MQAVRNQAGASLPGVRAELRRIGLDQGRDGRAARVAARPARRMARCSRNVRLTARGSAWLEMPFSFTSARTDRDATVEIAAAGRGAVLIDFVSLMRADVRKSGMLRPDLLASLRGLAPTFIRWPGGSFASTYKWQDGIGPFASRVYHPNEIWGGYSDYYGFGTDEYLELTPSARRRSADRVGGAGRQSDIGRVRDELGALRQRSADDHVGADARAQRPSRAVPRPLLPDRQRADEQRLHARALRRDRQSLRQAACGRSRRTP